MKRGAQISKLVSKVGGVRCGFTVMHLAIWGEGKVEERPLYGALPLPKHWLSSPMAFAVTL